ncbi:MAG TPA: DUF2796 domain-containing protein [Pseudomonas xinjiangensis]|uniref:DUF2796 domain-containing protein n=2 Tax=root TaxID=1 RepID=A0A7V1FTD3_9GAMM|nr:DUF2796 domain-containing protein [Halopseudomonas xinjiangensis]HEC48882.1 DUF2796 domain-containing protein [Halopseudomonas xinjiangensis]
MRQPRLLLAGLLTLCVATAHAQEHGHGSKDHHDHANEPGDSLAAHQHGVGSLNLIVDGATIEIELNSPANNLIGFEHTPSSEADIARVKDAMSALKQANDLFLLPAAADCTAEAVELESPLFQAVADEGHVDDSTHEHQGHVDASADGATHSDIQAHYRFTCSEPAALDQIEVAVFAVFPATEKLILQAIGERGQQGGELTAENNIIRF